MRISDKTPYRDENGQIKFLSRVEATLKYGLTWYPEVMAQEKIIAVFNKILDRNYILLRNFNLPDSDITIPMVLIGPPGIFLISVLHQGGLYSVRDDEWGTLAGETFKASRENLVQRLIQLGRVMKVYLSRSGFKGELTLEPIMIAANSAMHIETLRPAARIVLNDAVERFVISLTQARPILTADRIADIAIVLIKGPQAENSFVPEQGVLVSTPVPAGRELRDKLNPPSQPEQGSQAGFSSDGLGFSFDEHGNDNPESPYQARSSETGQDRAAGQPAANNQVFEGFDESFGGFDENANQPATDNSGSEQSALTDSEPSKPTVPTQKLRLGMTRNQLLILGGIMLVWLILVVAFIYIVNL